MWPSLGGYVHLTSWRADTGLSIVHFLGRHAEDARKAGGTIRMAVCNLRLEHDVVFISKASEG